MTTEIVKVSGEEVQANLKEGAANCKQLDRGAILLNDRIKLQAFGTIGFEGYTKWLLSGQPHDVDMCG